jgi:hypothetical protein
VIEHGITSEWIYSKGITKSRRLARAPSDAWLEAITLPPRAATDPIVEWLQAIPDLGPVLPSWCGRIPE